MNCRYLKTFWIDVYNTVMALRFHKCWCGGPIYLMTSVPGRMKFRFDNSFHEHQLGDKLVLKEEEMSPSQVHRCLL